MNLLDDEEMPEWFQYPRDFLRVVEQNLVDLTPWYLMGSKDVLRRMEGLRERYPGRELVPFARRDDNDDLACWERGKPQSVVIVHDFATAGHEERNTFPDFWSWFRRAIEDMIDFEP